MLIRLKFGNRRGAGGGACTKSAGPSTKSRDSSDAMHDGQETRKEMTK